MHENPAIPVLACRLSVPSQEFLESADGQAALATLRLVHGEVMWRYRRAFPVVNAACPAAANGGDRCRRCPPGDTKPGADAYGEAASSNALEGARSGAQAWAHMRQNVLGVFSCAAGSARRLPGLTPGVNTRLGSISQGRALMVPRVLAKAGPSEVIVSSTVKDLVAGSASNSRTAGLMC